MEPRVNAMTVSCRRCRGLMVREEFSDYWDDCGKMRFSGWRCVACGEIVDPVILNNRVFPVLYKGRARRYFATQLIRGAS
jgi:hypothetical protein